jgi:hypothetical protein
MWDELSDEDNDAGFDGQLGIRVSKRAGAYVVRLDLPENVPDWMDVETLTRKANRVVERMGEVDLSFVHSQASQSVQEELGRQRAKASR